jgi:putative membrane protein
MKPSNSLLNKSRHAIAYSGIFVFTMTNALAQQPQNYNYGPHMMWGDGWYGMILGPFLIIVFIGITVAVVTLIVRWLGNADPGHKFSSPPARDPLDILKERFAHGEIEKEEYEERRRVLRK